MENSPPQHVPTLPGRSVSCERAPPSLIDMICAFPTHSAECPRLIYLSLRNNRAPRYARMGHTLRDTAPWTDFQTTGCSKQAWVGMTNTNESTNGGSSTEPSPTPITAAGLA